MNSSYWILITHIFSLYPIGIFSWSWKIRKDIHSVFMILNFIFCVLFSLFYHNHDIEGIPYNNSDYGIWHLLDSQKSTSLILTTGLYVSRVRDPYFYNFCYISNIITLILALFKLPTFSTYYLILHLFINFIIKWRTIYRYLIKFKIISFLTISCGVSATICYYTALGEGFNQTYIFYHSLWHMFIFLSAGFGSILRYKLDQELYPIIPQRDTLDSI